MSNEKTNGWLPYLNDKNYRRVSALRNWWVPLIAYLYYLGDLIWGLPSTADVAQLCIALILILSLFLNGSSNRYKNSKEAYDGQMVVSEKEDGMKLFSLELDTAPEDMELKSAVTFKVEKHIL